MQRALMKHIDDCILSFRYLGNNLHRFKTQKTVSGYYRLVRAVRGKKLNPVFAMDLLSSLGDVEKQHSRCKCNHF
jgi:hypothetical protein